MEDIYLFYPPVEEMNRKELEDFIAELDLDIDASAYESTKQLRRAVLEQIGLA